MLSSNMALSIAAATATIGVVAMIVVRAEGAEAKVLDTLRGGDAEIELDVDAGNITDRLRLAWRC
jgi:hypothetical protein